MRWHLPSGSEEEEDEVCSDVSLGWLSGVCVWGGTSHPRWRVTESIVRASISHPQRRLVFWCRVRQSNFSWRELSTFSISCLLWSQSQFWQLESEYFLEFPADLQWNAFHHRDTSGRNSFETFHRKLLLYSISFNIFVVVWLLFGCHQTLSIIVSSFKKWNQRRFPKQYVVLSKLSLLLTSCQYTVGWINSQLPSILIID